MRPGSPPASDSGPSAMTARVKAPTLSLVVPMFNEAMSVTPFLEALLAELDRIDMAFEIICIDDGSRDDTLERLLAWRQRRPEIKVIEFSRNFGKEASLSAGLDYASGDAAIPIDCDLEDPVGLIPELVAKWREGFDVVQAVRLKRRGDTPGKRLAAAMFYGVFNRITEVSIIPNSRDFRLMDRRVVDVIRRMPERTRFMKGLFAWAGFRQASIDFEGEPRAVGRSKWSLWKLWNFAIDGITSFSTMPLRFWGYAGFCISSLAFGYGIYKIVQTLIFGIDVPGYASLLVLVLFFGGIQLITLGIIGEYLGRIFHEVKRRPIYVVRNSYGVAPARAESPTE
jgi:glycosyltransferase involved in cell wall biosynthesis